MSESDRIRSSPRPTAPGPASDKGDCGAGETSLLYGGLPRFPAPEKPAAETLHRSEGLRERPGLPASYLVLDAMPPEGFASPYPVSPDVADRWFRPDPGRPPRDSRGP
jgi:hypothetical protein